MGPTRLASGFVLTLSLWCAVRETRGAESSVLKALADGVYAHIVSPDGVYVSNAGVVLLSDAVLVFDTHFTPEGGEGLARQIRDVTARPVRYIALSHFHPDHTHGTQAFPDAAFIFAGTSARRDILEKDLPSVHRAVSLAQAQMAQMRTELDKSAEDARKTILRQQIDGRQQLVNRLTGLQIRVPLATVEDSLTIVDSSRTLQFKIFGPGHTDGDMILYLPKERIVFAADLFFNAALPNTEDSFLLAWMSALEQLLQLPAETYVPGHGDVAGRKEVEDFLRYLQDLRELVQPFVDRGEPLELAVRDCAVPARYASYRFHNFFPANVRKMYLELKARQLAAPPPEPPRPSKKPEEAAP
jgi:glyoxylase-like metal-dependent hydrolase (beta-lactamase superfamily II)